MIKPVKKNKRLKWIDSHYANFYKQGLFFQKCQMAGIVASGVSRSQAISRANSNDRIGKALAQADTMINMTKSMAKLPKVKGRVTK